MKKTIIIVLYLLIVGQLQAQNIVPIENYSDYITTGIVTLNLDFKT